MLFTPFQCQQMQKLQGVKTKNVRLLIGTDKTCLDLEPAEKPVQNHKLVLNKTGCNDLYNIWRKLKHHINNIQSTSTSKFLK